MFQSTWIPITLFLAISCFSSLAVGQSHLNLQTDLSIQTQTNHSLVTLRARSLPEREDMGVSFRDEIGALTWQRSFSVSGEIWLAEPAHGKRYVVVCGGFSGSIDFEVMSLHAGGEMDAFFVVFDAADGYVLGGGRLGGMGETFGLGLVDDRFGTNLVAQHQDRGFKICLGLDLGIPLVTRKTTYPSGSDKGVLELEIVGRPRFFIEDELPYLQESIGSGEAFAGSSVPSPTPDPELPELPELPPPITVVAKQDM